MQRYAKNNPLRYRDPYGLEACGSPGIPSPSPTPEPVGLGASKRPSSGSTVWDEGLHSIPQQVVQEQGVFSIPSEEERSARYEREQETLNEMVENGEISGEAAGEWFNRKLKWESLNPGHIITLPSHSANDPENQTAVPPEVLTGHY